MGKTKKKCVSFQIDHPAVTICYGITSKLFNATEITGAPTPFGMYFPRNAVQEWFNYPFFRYFQGAADLAVVGNASYYDLLEKLERKQVKVWKLNERM